MQRELTRSFGRGARLGAFLCSLVLVFALVGSVEVARPRLVAGAAMNVPTPDSVVAQATSIKAIRTPTKGTPLVGHEIDLRLLLAVQAREREFREAVFELGFMEPMPAAPGEDGIPIVTADVASAPAVPVRPALIVSPEELRAHLEPVFGDQAEVAFGIVMCESAGNATVNTGNGYYGLWQFDLATWASVGGTGAPSDASVEEQVLRAKMLYDARGWQPWGCH